MATFDVDVCAGLEASGHVVYYTNPEATPFRLEDVRRVGPYIGAYHTDSLRQAQATIFLQDNEASPRSVIAVHVRQSVMNVRHLMMSARNREAQAEFEAAQALAKAQASAQATDAIAKAQPASRPAPAPVLKPRRPVTSGAGGF